MEQTPRFTIGINEKSGSNVIENPAWMTETRARRLFKPLARFFNAFKYEPLRDGMWPYGDPTAHGGSRGEYTTGEDRNGMLGVLARIELNEEDGKDLLDGLPKDALTPKGQD